MANEWLYEIKRSLLPEEEVHHIAINDREFHENRMKQISCTIFFVADILTDSLIELTLWSPCHSRRIFFAVFSPPEWTFLTFTILSMSAKGFASWKNNCHDFWFITLLSMFWEGFWLFHFNHIEKLFQINFKAFRY